MEIADFLRNLGFDRDRTTSPDAGILRELPDMTPKTFYALEVFNIAYEEVD